MCFRLSCKQLIAPGLITALLLSFGGLQTSGAAGPTRSSALLNLPTNDNGIGNDDKQKPCKDKEKIHGNGHDKDDCLPEGGSSGIVKADFNGDGFADLAVGVPNEDVDGFQDAGAVAIIYGSTDGLHQNLVTINQFITQGDISADPSVVPGTNHQFGAALAAGNFNGDIFSDLAIGIPLQNGLQAGRVDEGRVVVLYGSSSGLSSTGSQIFAQGFAGLLDSEEGSDRFGSVLSWGDFDGDTFGDLAIGIPDEDDGADIDAGAVQIIFGSSTGLTPSRNQIWFQSTPGILDVSEAGDKFGTTLAAGDFNGDQVTDLAVGVPLENVGSISDAGAVNVIYGAAGIGLTEANDQFLTQDTVQGVGQVLDQAEAFDKFGASLAAGDFDEGDTRFINTTDLAIGVPFEDVPLSINANIVDAGAVNVLYGSKSTDNDPVDGLSVVRNQFWTQDSPGVPGESEEGDRFGSSLAAGNFDNNRTSRRVFDLAIGVPFEDVGSIVDAGAVNIIYGSFINLGLDPNGTQTTPAQIFDQNSSDIADLAETGDRFGSSLSAWNFGRDTPNPLGNSFQAADLAIGIPFEDFSGRVDVGAVAVLYGGDGGANSSGNQFWNQNSAGIVDFCEDGDRFGTTLY